MQQVLDRVLMAMVAVDDATTWMDARDVCIWYVFHHERSCWHGTTHAHEQTPCKQGSMLMHAHKARTT